MAHRVSRLLLRGALVVLLACPAHAQPRQLLDMRYPLPGIARFTDEWGSNYGQWPVFAGDVDGDGREDFLIKKADPNHGRGPFTVLLYGDSSFPPVQALSCPRQTRLIHGEFRAGIYPECDQLYPYAALGDIDGDSHADFLFNSCRFPPNNAGIVVLVFGGSGWPAEVAMDDLGAAGIRSLRLVCREPEQWFGTKLSACGDVNGDGKLDMAIASTGDGGTENGAPHAGRVHVIYGGFDTADEIDISEIGWEIPGFEVRGAYGEILPSEWGDDLGGSLAAAGDLNGDGYDDLLMGAKSATRVASLGGAVYVLYGAPDRPAELLAAHPEQFGVEFQGADAGGFFGWVVAAAGDVDGDGLEDFIAGAPAKTMTGLLGAAIVIYGSRDWPSVVRLDDPALRTFRLQETPVPWANPNGDQFGSNVLGLGDWNADGFSDFLVAAPWKDIRWGSHTGAAYVVFGGSALPPLASDVHVGTPDLAGLVLLGAESLHQFAKCGDSRGDLDGDGKRDLLLVAPFLETAGRVPLEETTIYLFPGGTGAGPGVELLAVEPPEGHFGGGYPVVLRGQGFRGDERVFFGGAEAVVVEVPTSAEMKVVVPAAPGPGAASVEVRGPAGTASLQEGFRYIETATLPDILLDPEDLASKGYRCLVYRDFFEPRLPFEARGFIRAYFGDVDGDRVDDLLISRREDGGSMAVIFGGKPLPVEIGAGETEEYGTVIVREPDAVGVGLFLGFPGDVDDDGKPDVALGGTVDLEAPDPFNYSGRTYVLNGRSQWPPSLELAAEIEAGRSIRLRHAACGLSQVACPGDMEGHGRSALVVGFSQCRGAEAEVRLYLDGLGPEMGAAQAPAVVTGDPAPEDWGELGLGEPRFFGSALSEAGDMNSDGRPDFLVGAPGFRGGCFILLGGEWTRGNTSINDLETQGRAIRVSRELNLGDFGESVAPAGDFNGDGLADAAFGVPGGGRDFDGEVHIVFGATELGKSLRLLNLVEEGPWHVQIDGEFPYDWQGHVYGLGDLNGDAYSDVGIMGFDERNRQARAYIVFGEPHPPARISLGSLGSRGFRLLGKEGNWFSGHSPGGMAAGDFDGDGLRDLAMGESTLEGHRVIVLYGWSWSGAGFVRGEANGDGSVNISDAVAILGYLFLGGAGPACLDGADVNDDGFVNITDAIYLLGHLFLGTAAPPPPYPTRGQDPTADGIKC